MNGYMKTEIKFSRDPQRFIKEDLGRYPDTLPGLLEHCVRQYEDRPFVGMHGESMISYRDFYQRVRAVEDLLRKKGVNRGDRVSILGENSPNWVISFFALLYAGAVAVPILHDFPESDIRHILGDCEAEVLFTTRQQWEKLSHLRHTRVKTVIMMDDFSDQPLGSGFEFLSELKEWARDFMGKFPKPAASGPGGTDRDDVCSIIYTSGTSGHSKAVMLTHRNLVSNVVAASLLMELGATDKFLSILPISHTYEFTVGFLLPMFHGCHIVYIGKPPTPRILETVCRKEKPTAICSVPLVLEKIYKRRVLPVLEKNRVVKLIARIPGIRSRLHKVIAKKLMDFFGGNLRVMPIGGASFNIAAEEFFKKIGFPYLIGYGLTETAPLLAGGPMGNDTIRTGSTGKVTPGCEIRIADPDPRTGIGEILGRGPNVMKGYYHNPELTAEMVDEDGWFRTGDLGSFDSLDNLYIRGRSKNIIVLSNGENIYPEAIEGMLNACSHILESLVILNQGRLEGWVYMNYDLVDEKTAGQPEIRRSEYIDSVLKEIQDRVNAKMPSYARISRLVEQPEPFLKTVTHKIKRYLYTHRQG